MESHLELNTAKTKAIIVANRLNLKYVIDPAPLNAGNSKVMFVQMDSELTLEPLYKNVDQKSFTLKKIRRYIDVNAAKAMYKQMILPLFDYNKRNRDKKGNFRGVKIVLYVHV